MRLVLTFNEIEPHEGRKSVQHITFHLERKLEDFNYGVYGGVGRSLNIP